MACDMYSQPTIETYPKFCYIYRTLIRTLMNRFFCAAALCLCLSLFAAPASGIDLPEKRLGEARAKLENGRLTVSTGRVERVWQLNPQGLRTVSLTNLASGKQWTLPENGRPGTGADWDLPQRIDGSTPAQALSVRCTETDDEQFTSAHLLVETTFRYPCGLEVRHLVRVYPGAPGIWTALEVRSYSDSFSAEGVPADLSTQLYYGSRQPLKIARSEWLPVDFSTPTSRTYWGLYNDPGNRVNTEEMLCERTVTGFPLFQDEENTWASGLDVRQGGEGIILLKESNKTVNRYGHQTGAFYCTRGGAEVTGWGLLPTEISGEFKRSWPTWTILYQGGEDEMELAFKSFDRVRYPVRPETDMHILIDTWGSDWQGGDYDKLYGRENSAFKVVEREIRSAADLGIDIVRIDDGWQAGRTMERDVWHPNPGVGYDPHWAKMRALSESTGVKIGLWIAIDYATVDEMKTNYTELGGVATWKFDFDKLGDHDAFARRVKSIRDFIRWTGYKTQTSWCPEYDDQRYGWYSAVRECGPMYFQNIQNNLPHHLTYVPYITLRHHWNMARYYNLNSLQCHWQNPARTNPARSDAPQHSQGYCALGSLVGAPSCFMLTQLLEPAERDELRSLLSDYKKHRAEIFDSYVFAVGAEPDNASWTGFQICRPERRSGYLMVFRELHNGEASHRLGLRFLKEGTGLRITDVRTGVSTVQTLRDGGVELAIDRPADYLFLRYEIL